jgi:hypothetical protein
MFPSKMMPTNSPARLMVGPELPPMMSAVSKLSGVSSFSFDWRSR